VVRLLLDAESNLLANFTFPETHRRQIASTNSLKRPKKEIKRRTAVVVIRPNRAAVICLVGVSRVKQHDERQDVRRSFWSELMTPIDAVVKHKEVKPGFLMAI
jgi:transposase-like protein